MHFPVFLPRRVVTVVTLCAALACGTVAPAAAGTWRFDTIDGTVASPSGRIASQVGTDSSAVVWRDHPHVFHRDATSGDLRHSWWSATTWRSETLDGNGRTDGRTTNDVGHATAAVVWNDTPHVFHVDRTNADLRHSWWTPAGWRSETLDGRCSAQLVCAISGARDVAVDAHVAAVVFNGVPHVLYRDATDGDLRHGWWSPAAGSWQFVTLDGHTTDPAGRVDRAVGADPSVVVWGGQLHVFHRDATARALRHAYWSPDGWRFSTLDGRGSALVGATRDDVGVDTTAFARDAGPHVVYRDVTTRSLRHAFWTGQAWAFEDLDGRAAIAAPGRVGVDVGAPAAFTWRGTPHVVYRAGDDVRHAWWSPDGWRFEALDGACLSGECAARGAIGGRMGRDVAVFVWRDRPHYVTDEADRAMLRHGWFS